MAFRSSAMGLTTEITFQQGLPWWMNSTPRK
jgi:hypothetical protein